MPDRKKVISWLECLAQPDWRKFHSDTEVQVIAESALALLKEQEDLGTELTNAVELIHKKNERIEKLLKEQEAVVRCKDCKNQYKYRTGSCPFYTTYGVVAQDDWFCADGVRKGGR